MKKEPASAAAGGKPDDCGSGSLAAPELVYEYADWKLTLKDDKITDITASAEGISDDDVQNALKAIEEKLKAKSGEQLGSIDDLSDGSEASKGIIEAVKQALKDAKA